MGETCTQKTCQTEGDHQVLCSKIFFFFVIDTFSDENNEIFSSVTLCKDIKNISCAILKIIFSPQTMPGTHASIW